MRKLFASAVIMGVANALAVGCTCGSAGYSGGSSFGILSQYNTSFIGLSWGRSKIESRFPGLEEDGAHLHFHTIEVAGKYFPLKRFFVAGAVPFRFSRQERAGTPVSGSGFGDVMLSAGYLLLKPPDARCRPGNHTLSVGAGIKMPTGRYDAAAASLPDAFLQPGTGSWDALFHATYTFRYRLFGVLAEGSYIINTVNRQDVKFGNRFSFSASGFYSYKKGKFSLTPSAGALFENAARDVIAGTEQDISGGNVLSASAALNLHYRKTAAGFSFQLPAYQNIADGLMKSKPKWTLHVSYIF